MESFFSEAGFGTRLVLVESKEECCCDKREQMHTE